MSIFIDKNNSDCSNFDRFIPKRRNRDLDVAHFKLMTCVNNDHKRNFDIFSLKPRQLNNYINLLQETIDYQNSPILSIRNKRKKRSEEDDRASSKVVSHWPCKPRRYSLLDKPDIILDLPNIEMEIAWNIVDWGSNGYLATIWSNKVYLWKNKKLEKDEVMNTKIKGFGALKWNHTGTKLAVGNETSTLTVWTFPEQKALYQCVCCVRALCKISCLAWDMEDQLLVSGCTRGLLAVWGPNGYCTESIWAHERRRIISLAFCKSNRYICSSATDGKVRIFLWPSCNPHVELAYCSPVRAIGFHPWRTGLLAIGGGIGDGSIAIWNINTRTKIGCMLPQRKSLVDCLTWNQLTGELVTSHRLYSNNETETKILVLSSLDKVVDCIDNHTERVLYLLWDRTGTKLATASSDESLCIWNFFGPNTKNYNPQLNQYKMSGLRKRNILSNFENCIR